MIGTPPLPPWFHGLLPDLRVPVSHGWVEGVCLFERGRLTESGVWWLRFFWPIKIQWEETIDCNWSLRSPCHQYGISALVSQTSFGGKPLVSSRNVRWVSQAVEWPGVEQCSCIVDFYYQRNTFLYPLVTYIHTNILYCFLPAKGAFQEQSLFTSITLINYNTQHSTNYNAN